MRILGPFGLDGKAALVTGAGQDINRAFVPARVRRCEKMGFRVRKIFGSPYTPGRDAPLGRLHLTTADELDFFTPSESLCLLRKAWCLTFCRKRGIFIYDSSRSLQMNTVGISIHDQIRGQRVQCA